MDPKSNSTPGNSHNDHAEFSHDGPKVAQSATTHPAMAATIMQNFHHVRQHNNTQQTGNGRNDYADNPKSRNNTTAHNKPATAAMIMRDNTTTHNKMAMAMAATIMQNFHTVSTQKIPAGQNGLNTSFSRENLE